MGPETEAACLLRSGHAYPRRVGLAGNAENLVFAGFKPGGFSLYFGDEPCFHFDLEGRWQRVLIDGIHFLKALDGAVESITRDRTNDGMVLRRRRLSFAETADLDSTIRTDVLNLIEGLEEGRIRLQVPPDPASQVDRPVLREMLDRIVLWDPAAWFRNRELYLSTYRPPGFLPPSCPSPIVLEATASSRDDFGFPPLGTTHRTLEEFAEHVDAVSHLLGRRAAQARGLVIQHGDFWDQPADRIRPYLDAAKSVFRIAPTARRPRLSERPLDRPLLEGFFAFVSVPLLDGPDAPGWSLLAENGLRRVDLGLSSVFDDSCSDSLKTLVPNLQSAGIGVGLVLPVGVDSSLTIDEEAERTVSWVESLGLQATDHVYLIDDPEFLSDSPESPDRRDAIRARLQAHRPKGGYRVVPYTLAKQIL